MRSLFPFLSVVCLSLAATPAGLSAAGVGRAYPPGRPEPSRPAVSRPATPRQSRPLTPGQQRPATPGQTRPVTPRQDRHDPPPPVRPVPPPPPPPPRAPRDKPRPDHGGRRDAPPRHRAPPPPPPRFAPPPPYDPYGWRPLPPPPPPVPVHVTFQYPWTVVGDFISGASSKEVLFGESRSECEIEILQGQVGFLTIALRRGPATQILPVSASYGVGTRIPIPIDRTVTGLCIVDTLGGRYRVLVR